MGNANTGCGAAPPHLVRGDVLDIGPDVLAELVDPEAVTVVVDSGFAAHLAPTDRERLGSLLRVAARSGVVVTISREPAERPSGWRLSAMRFRDLTTGRLIDYCVGDLVSERVAWVGPM